MNMFKKYKFPILLISIIILVLTLKQLNIETFDVSEKCKSVCPSNCKTVKDKNNPECKACAECHKS